MRPASNQILTVAQMRAAEDTLIAAGIGVDTLMALAGRGAAEWIFRLAWPRTVTVLCGPGNNGGDGYVIAETLRQRGLAVRVVAPLEPATGAARNARSEWQGEVLGSAGDVHGAVLVDCLFGSGLTRPLDDALFALLVGLADRHTHCVAVDLPSGVESDSGATLNRGLPGHDLTIALGAWKFAHWAMPATGLMGERRIVPIGVEEISGAAQLVARPILHAPARDAHKYSRGLLAVVAGAMPGAALLAAQAAMRGGAGYVKLASASAPAGTPAELVVDPEALADTRLAALLAGPGLGRTERARLRVEEVLRLPVPRVLDADALMLLRPEMPVSRTAPMIATPHDGELAALAAAFGVTASGKQGIARKLAERLRMVVVAKGADTMIVSPEGRMAMLPTAPSWLSVAGTGDVLAGLIASRLSTGADPFAAACEGAWLHREAARIAGPVLTPGSLIEAVPAAYGACL